MVEILLRVESRSRRDGSTGDASDVVATVEPSHTVADLTAALAAELGRTDRPGLARPGAAVLDPGTSLADTGLLSGQRLVLVGEDGEAPGRSGPPSQGPELVVTSGPDVGRRLPLVPGPLIVGRDWSCDLVLGDPFLDRRHLVVSVGDERAGPPIVVAPGPGGPRPIWVDGSPLLGAAAIGPGDAVRIGSTTLTIEAGKPRGRGSPVPPSADDGGFGVVAFHRTPYYPSPVPARTFGPLGEVPQRPEPTRFAVLAALAPLVMGLVLALLYSPRMLIISVFSPIVAVAAHVEQKRRNEARYGRSEERFGRRLARRRVEVAEALAFERSRRVATSPDLATLAARARTRDGELWIRDRTAADFLRLRLGLGDTAPSVVVEPETQGDEALRDQLDAEREAKAIMADVPITVDLAEDAVVGLVGAPEDVTALVSSLMLQVACLHSPEDVVIVAATDPGRRLGSWLKWLPHSRAASSPLAPAHSATTRGEANRLVADLLAVAEARLAEADRSLDRRWPWLVVVLDRELDPEPAIVSRLADLCPRAGVSLVWLTTAADRVLRQATVVVDAKPLLGATRSIVSHTDPDRADQPLEIDRVGQELATELACDLAPVRDASTATAATALPRTVSLLDSLGPSEIDEGWIVANWHRRIGYRLPAPIGVGAGGPFTIDLVEDGPHGLIGGTSGSGKSELLTSIVAGLVALNPPDRLNLLFVDYKGGSSAQPFLPLPHTVGCVTNLDAALARRALTSLRAELNRRMAILEGRAKDLAEMLDRSPGEAPPSLVIVIDEFATLVKEIPDFMAGIVDIAQRGRSLGIHLLLATQRPSGAVNENILANTNLRISLRMLDAAESASVIGSNDAAFIPTPLRGRALARIGSGELQAFQSAWSGAPRAVERGPRPITVWPFPAPARAEPRPDPTSSPGAAAGTPVAATQLDGLIEAVRLAAERLGLGPGPAPWCDELPAGVALTELRPAADPPPAGAPTSLVVGLIDDPERQRQYPARFDLEAGGGVLIVGTGGAGKTTALRTVALSAALDDSDRGGGGLTILGLDFASRGLGVLGALPQCAEIATGDDLEAVTRIVAVLDGVLDERREATARAARDGVARPGFTPVLLLIDDYGNLAQAFEGSGAPAGSYGWLDTVNRLVVDGRQVGIHCALTAPRRSVVKAGLLSAISNRIVLRQLDSASFAELGLPAAVTADLELGPGRGFTSASAMIQVANLTGTDDDDAEVGAIRQLAGELVGRPDPRVATTALPAEVGPLPPSTDPLVVPLGPADLGRSPVAVDLGAGNLTIVGDPGSGRSTALATVAHQLRSGGVEVWTVGPPGAGLAPVPVDRPAFGSTDQLLAALDDLVGLAAGAERGRAPVLLLDDVDLLDDPALDPAMARVCSLGIRWVAATTPRPGFSTSPLVADMRTARALLYLQPPGVREVQELAGCRPPLRPGLALPPGRGVLVVKRHPVVVQVARPGPVEAAGHPAKPGPGAELSAVATRCRAPRRSARAPASG